MGQVCTAFQPCLLGGRSQKQELGKKVKNPKQTQTTKLTGKWGAVHTKIKQHD